MGRPRVALALSLGLAAGIAYAIVNRIFDVRTAYGSLPSALAPVHAFVDQVLPLIAGALLGLAAHYVRLRKSLAGEERARVEELEARLRGVERDQAAWVLAASVLHEVRNPLHTLGLVLDEVVNASDAERAALVEKAQLQSGRVDARLAEMRRIPSGAQPHAASVPLDVLAESVVSGYTSIVERGGVAVAVTAERGAVVSADAAYVRVIVENLIQNALESLRARGRGGRIDVAVRRSGKSVELSVKDDGPGPDAAARASLFEPLASTKVGGLGLGLSIARALARAMEGELSCDVGSTFRLVLPAVAA
ncbi:ATP-binding protein [soil metagenome]